MFFASVESTSICSRSKDADTQNIELTAPYMHNEVFRTLDEVMDFYDGGGGARSSRFCDR